MVAQKQISKHAKEEMLCGKAWISRRFAVALPMDMLLHFSPTSELQRGKDKKNKQGIRMISLRKSSFSPHFIKFSSIQWQHGSIHHMGVSVLELVRSVPRLRVGGDVETSPDLHVGPFPVP